MRASGLSQPWQRDSETPAARVIAFTWQTSERWRLQDPSAYSRPASTASSRDYVWSPKSDRDPGEAWVEESDRRIAARGGRSYHFEAEPENLADIAKGALPPRKEWAHGVLRILIDLTIESRLVP